VKRLMTDKNLIWTRGKEANKRGVVEERGPGVNLELSNAGETIAKEPSGKKHEIQGRKKKKI